MKINTRLDSILSGKDSNFIEFSSSPERFSSFRFTRLPMPSGIAMCQKRNNSLCGMMVHAKYKNERRITVFLLPGSSSSCSHSLTSRLVRALQSPSPLEIATKIDMCENGSEMVQAKYKVKCEKINDLTFGN